MCNKFEKRSNLDSIRVMMMTVAAQTKEEKGKKKKKLRKHLRIRLTVYDNIQNKNRKHMQFKQQQKFIYFIINLFIL